MQRKSQLWSQTGLRLLRELPLQPRASCRREDLLGLLAMLDQQIGIMDRAKGASEVDTWFTNIAEFMKGNGTIPTVPAATSYIDDAPMKRVAADPKLKAFATKSD